MLVISDFILDIFLRKSQYDLLTDLCEVKEKEGEQRLHQSFGPK